MISIHAPREGGDLVQPVHAPAILISIHAPREGGDSLYKAVAVFSRISIHAPREGGDTCRSAWMTAPPDFNPRPPRGGRLLPSLNMTEHIVISIHAPREGGDYQNLQ